MNVLTASYKIIVYTYGEVVNTLTCVCEYSGRVAARDYACQVHGTR